MLHARSAQIAGLNQSLAHVRAHEEVVGIFFDGRPVELERLLKPACLSHQEAPIGQHAVILLRSHRIQDHLRSQILLGISQLADGLVPVLDDKLAQRCVVLAARLVLFPERDSAALQFRRRPLAANHVQQVDAPILASTSALEHAVIVALGCFLCGVREKPISTVTSVDHHSLVAAYVSKMRGENVGHGADEPLHTISVGGTHHAAVAALLVKYYGNERDGVELSDPMHTIPTRDRLGLVTVQIGGEPYVITDIGMRMLQPHELYIAQGFAAGFAAFLFKVLPAAEARLLIRRAFPHFYLFVLGAATAAALLSMPFDGTSATVLALIAVTTVLARQILMPAINHATDQGQRARFVRLNGLSVLVTLAHIAAAAAVLIRLAD